VQETVPIPSLNSDEQEPIPANINELQRAGVTLASFYKDLVVDRGGRKGPSLGIVRAYFTIMEKRGSSGYCLGLSGTRC